MRRARGPAVLLVIAAAALLVSGSAAAAPAKTKKSCQLLKPAEVTAAFGTEASAGTQQGSDCTWQVGDRALSLELTTKDAKSTFSALRDLAKDAAASPPERVRGVGNQAVYAEIQSFKQLLVLTGKNFLFLRVLDIASPIDTATAKAALTDLGKKAVKRV
jgi:hypothetical protein